MAQYRRDFFREIGLERKHTFIDSTALKSEKERW
jgi:hypothetical protein